MNADRKRTEEKGRKNRACTGLEATNDRKRLKQWNIACLLTHASERSDWTSLCEANIECTFLIIFASMWSCRYDTINKMLVHSKTVLILFFFSFHFYADCRWQLCYMVWSLPHLMIVLKCPEIYNHGAHVTHVPVSANLNGTKFEADNKIVSV